MKMNHTVRIGNVALATLLTGLMSSCASHKTSAVTPINLPKAQVTLTAPKSVEGAWIKLRLHDAQGSQTGWWYIKNGKAYLYGNEETTENGHPVSPTRIDLLQYGRTPIACQDNLGRSCIMGIYTYTPTGATAKLRIANGDRHDTTLCRSVSIGDNFIDSVSQEPALITFKSNAQGVYEGTVKGVFAPECMPAENVQYVDSITIFTK